MKGLFTEVWAGYIKSPWIIQQPVASNSKAQSSALYLKGQRKEQFLE